MSADQSRRNEHDRARHASEFNEQCNYIEIGIEVKPCVMRAWTRSRSRSASERMSQPAEILDKQWPASAAGVGIE